MSPSFLCTIDQGTPAFDSKRTSVEIVCAGDSLTGWNNFGPQGDWPFCTYPDVLQELCEPSGLRIANGGIAGEVSDNGPKMIREYLELFPNARHYIIGMGTNDLAIQPDTVEASHRIIGNLELMVQMVQQRHKQPILFNVPHVNESVFPPSVVRQVRAKRDYHNPRLRAFCEERDIPLADICSRLEDKHFGDNLHPNDEGATIMAEAIFEAFSPLYSK